MKKKNWKDKPNFSGVVTALITPFKKGAVDFKSLKNLVRHQLDNGIQGFVVGGTTAESPTLTWKEVEKIFRTVKAEVAGQVPILVGTGTNDTKSTVQRTRNAKTWGADAALVVVPYYNKPPQRGMIAHFKAVAKTGFPVVLYNVPGRTVVSMTSDTIAELSRVKNIVGVKEASGDLNVVHALKSQVNEDFLLSSGDDPSAVDFILDGGHGVVSVISHVIPQPFVEICRRARAMDESVRAEYVRFKNLNQLIGCEANPIPVKMAMYQMGIIASPELRLPLVELASDKAASLKIELANLGLV